MTRVPGENEILRSVSNNVLGPATPAATLVTSATVMVVVVAVLVVVVGSVVVVVVEMESQFTGTRSGMVRELFAESCGCDMTPLQAVRPKDHP